MKVPTYKSQTGLAEQGGAKALGVRADGGALSASSRAMAGFGDELQRQGLTFYERMLTEQRDTAFKDAEIKYNAEVSQLQNGTLTESPSSVMGNGPQSFKNRAQASATAIGTAIEDKVVRKRFLQRSKQTIGNVSIAVNKMAYNRQIDQGLATKIAYGDDLQNQIATGSPAVVRAATEELFGVVFKRDGTKEKVKPSLYETMAQAGYISQTKAASLEIAAASTIEAYSIEKDVNSIDYLSSSDPTGAAAAANQLYIDLQDPKKFSGLDPAKRLAYQRQAINLKQSIETSAASKQRAAVTGVKKDINEQITTVTGSLNDGLIPTANDMDSIKDILSNAEGILSNNDFVELSENASILTQLVDSAGAVKNMNGTELADYIAALPRDTDGEKEVLTFMKKRFAAQDKAVRDDPLTWASDNGAQNISEVDFSTALTNPDFPAELIQRRNEGLAVQDLYDRDDLGLNPVLMRPEEVRQVSAMLTEMNAEKKLAFIGKVQNAIGKDSGFLFEQLGKDAPMMSYLGGLASVIGLDGKRSNVLNEIMRGMEYGDQVSVKQLSNNQNNDVNFNFILSDAFSGLPDEMRQELEPSLREAVEALLTYQVRNNRLDLTSDDAEFSQEQLRAVVSYALGGSKDGITGGLGVIESDAGSNSYLRPPFATDDEFVQALQFLPTLFPDAKENIIADTLEDKYHVLASSKENGDIVYRLYDLGDDGIVDPSTMKVIGTLDGNDIVFTYDQLVEAADKAAEIQVEVDKMTAQQALNERQIRNPEVIIKGAAAGVRERALAAIAAADNAALEVSAQNKIEASETVTSAINRVLEAQDAEK